MASFQARQENRRLLGVGVFRKVKSGSRTLETRFTRR